MLADAHRQQLAGVPDRGWRRGTPAGRPGAARRSERRTPRPPGTIPTRGRSRRRAHRCRCAQRWRALPAARVRRGRAGIRPQWASLAPHVSRSAAWVLLGGRLPCFAVAVAVSVATIMCGPAPRARADGCPDVQLIFARGTAEPPGLGAVGDALFAALQPALGSRIVEAYPVNYPASYNFLTTGDAANDARDHIAQMADQCPATRLVLGGFSQGAAAVSMLAGVPPLGNTSVTSDRLRRWIPVWPARSRRLRCSAIPATASTRPCRRRGCSPAVPSTCAAPVIRSASSAVATAMRTTTTTHRPTPARRRDSSRDWCRPY